MFFSLYSICISLPLKFDGYVTLFFSEKSIQKLVEVLKDGELEKGMEPSGGFGRVPGLACSVGPRCHRPPAAPALGVFAEPVAFVFAVSL